MLLQHLFKKENKDQLLADKIYNDMILLMVDFFKFNKAKIDKNFINSFYMSSFFLFFIFYCLKSNSSSYSKNISQLIMNNFINDIDHTLKLEGIGDMKIGKYVKYYIKKFYFYLKIFEKNTNDNFLDLTNFLECNNLFRLINIQNSDNELLRQLLLKLKNNLKTHKLPYNLDI